MRVVMINNALIFNFLRTNILKYIFVKTVEGHGHI